VSDLSVTALYTAATWAWAGLPNADLLDHADARRVFRAVNGALALARPFQRAPDAPLPVGLLHRHAFIDAHLGANRSARVLELAAGLSRRGVTMSAGGNIDYVEVDLPPVIARKRALLERTAAGRAALARPNLRFVEGDVLTTSLDELAPADGRALAVVAEGLMMYLDAATQELLSRKVAARLRLDGGGMFVFDLVPPSEQPPPGAAGRALGWLMKRFTGGRGFALDARSRGDILEALRRCGFRDVQAIEPRSVARVLGLPRPDAPTRQLVFVGSV
jgi:O-methyltransferase involved in polyketide biosynthesis